MPNASWTVVRTKIDLLRQYRPQILSGAESQKVHTVRETQPSHFVLSARALGSIPHDREPRPETPRQLRANPRNRANQVEWPLSPGQPHDTDNLQIVRGGGRRRAAVPSVRLTAFGIKHTSARPSRLQRSPTTARETPVTMSAAGRRSATATSGNRSVGIVRPSREWFVSTLGIPRVRARHVDATASGEYRLCRCTTSNRSRISMRCRMRRARQFHTVLSLPFNPFRCSEDRLRPFVKRTGPWLERTRRVDPRVPCGVSDARRRKTEANRTDRPTGDFRVAGTPPGRTLTPPGACSDDGGRRPWASRRSCLGRGAPPVLAPGRPCPGRGGFGHRGSR